MIAASLRDARASLLADTSLRGVAFGEALADAVDGRSAIFSRTSAARPASRSSPSGRTAGAELCPGSDVDVLLVHNLKGRRAADTSATMTEQLWYPLWDAGFVTGHGART